jgi:peptide/nickel transport system permease protein
VVLTLIMRRVLVGLATLLFVSLVIFLGTQVLPGDAAQIRLGQEATPENVALLRQRLGLDRPLHVVYLSWLGGLLHGDLGLSLANEAPVSAMIATRWYNTAVVAALTAAIAVPLSVSLGLFAAMSPGGAFDRGLTTVNVGLIAAPEFFVATTLVAVFVLSLNLGSAIVVGGAEGKGPLGLLRHFIYPVLTLVIVTSSQMIRMTRAALLNVLRAPYVEMALLKGVPRWRLVVRHALPNAVGPIVNVIALNLAYLISGVVVVEVYFGYPGLAVMMVQAVQTRDFIVVQAVGMLFCAAYVGIILVADIAALLSNPRLRHPR